MSEDYVRLSGMRFTGRHGVLEAERELGQPFVVDVALRLDLAPAGKSDDLRKTVDYRRLHDRAKETVEGEPVCLIETLAERIAALASQTTRPPKRFGCGSQSRTFGSGTRPSRAPRSK